MLHSFLELLTNNQREKAWGICKSTHVNFVQLAPKFIPYFLLIFTDFQNQVFSSDLHISGKWEPK